MSDPEPPKVGSRVTVRWPGGPYGWTLDVVELDPADYYPRPAPGWLYICGDEVESPTGGYPTRRTFYVRPTGRPGEYELKPKLL